jgi:hypothetical protein
MDHGTVIVNLPQPDSPVQLVSTIHSNSDLLSAATLKNVGQKLVSACRLGWVVVFPTGSNELHLGVPMNISAGIEPGAIWDAPAQSVSPEFTKHKAAAIDFFVAEVYQSVGEPWKADLAQIRQQARRVAIRSQR